MAWSYESDAPLFAAARRDLFVAVVGDVLDRLGYRKQFLPPELRPIDPGMVILGRAMPVLEADVGSEPHGSRSEAARKPFGVMFEALDDLRPGEIYICAGASPRYALWGGLMSVRAMQCGAAGAVLDGYHRDTSEILRLGFAVASTGSYAQDQAGRGQVVDWRIPIEIGGVSIRPGDVIYGDRDGVLVVPAETVAETFEAAFAKARGENDVLAALQNGMGAAEAFAKFGIM